VEPPFRIVPAGDSAFLVEFEERIDAAVNASTVALAESLRVAAVPGVRDIVPTFRSVAVYFDPLKTETGRLVKLIESSAGTGSVIPAAAAPIRVPVCYGGEFGPDLADVAAFAGIEPLEVVALHASRPYRVFMLGFLPGFAYMGAVDPRIAAPRRTSPRVRVPAGSVGIAGAQTGIYPADSPGGWQIIGRTPLKPFDLERAAPCLFAAGDAVQFYPIGEGELREAAAP
jgi:inhibitor of KinA